MSSRTRLATWLAVPTLLLTGSAGVAVAVVTAAPIHGTDQSFAPAAPAPQGVTTRVGIDSRHRAHVAAPLRPGVHRFLVTAQQPAVLQLVRPDAGYTRVQAAADINAAYGVAASEPARMRFEAHTTTLGGVSVSAGHTGELWQRLTAGTYWLLDTKTGVYTAADLTAVTVTGAAVTGVLAAPATLTVGADDTWSAGPSAVDADGVVSVVNHGTRDHAVTVVRLEPGQTMVDVRAYLASGADLDAAPWVGQALSPGTVSPGSSMVVGYDLLPGRYAVLGWWPDGRGVGGEANALVRQLRIR